jgi:hypothetical protein
MDLIYTNAKLVDQGVLLAYGFDLSFGAQENDFEMVLSEDVPLLEYGAFVYIDGTEYGGIVDAIKTATNGSTITYAGRTWHGYLNSKVISPDSGADYLTVSGEANAILATLINRLTLSELFTASEEASGINISSYKFNRYCKGYDGIRAMLESNGAKLKIEWKDRAVQLSAVPIADYTESPIDGDVAKLTVEHHEKAVNHLICLGSGELAAREVLHLYVDQFGRIGTAQHYTGLDEYTDTLDYGNAESSEDLKKSGVERLKELRGNNSADISIIESDGITFDVGDIVGAKEQRSGISVTATVTQKIVKITNGAVRTEYKTGG